MVNLKVNGEVDVNYFATVVVMFTSGNSLAPNLGYFCTKFRISAHSPFDLLASSNLKMHQQPDTTSNH
jgi:hypothetical protein